MSADILDQDIQLLESVVMDDVPDGGRGPTGKEIKYGKENSIFGDVTEVNRRAATSAFGRFSWVSARPTRPS